MNKIKYMLAFILVITMGACNKSNTGGHTHDTIGGSSDHDDHEHGEGTMSYTLFTGGYELFVEFPALVVGQTSEFAAHFTRMEDYKPVTEGQLTVSIVKDGRGLRHKVDAPSSPGIFRPALQPKEAGTYQMFFQLESSSGDVRFKIPSVEVYATADEAAHAPMQEEQSDAVTYLKEQAWKTEFHTAEIQPQPFYSVIHTSAKVKHKPRAEITLNAQTAGTVQILAVPGESVEQGDLLALVTGSGIENNTTLKLNERKIAFERSRSDYLRLKPLAEKQLVSQKEFLETKTRYQQDSLRYYQLTGLVSQNGLKIIAPMDGIVTRIMVSNGQFAESGSPLITVAETNQLLIEAYVNPSDFQKVNGIFDANFLIDKDEIIALSETGGQIISKNAFVNEHHTRIPVAFSIENNGKLMPGMFLETFLKTGKKDQALVVPLSAIIEEQGQYFVFVQTGGESFVKRQVEPGGSDGQLAEVVSGLSPGERIVTRGAYQIKLAALAGELPLHGHTH